jgi:hypothetical protein
LRRALPSASAPQADKCWSTSAQAASFPPQTDIQGGFSTSSGRRGKIKFSRNYLGNKNSFFFVNFFSKERLKKQE